MPLDEWGQRTVGERTAGLARYAAEQQALGGGGVSGRLYDQLMAMTCWESAILCAWLAGGIELNPEPGPPALAAGRRRRDVRPEAITQYPPKGSAAGFVGRNSWGNLFSEQQPVGTAAAIAGIPLGAFVGFIAPDQALQHVMIYVGNGRAAGSNNGAIFLAVSRGGWEDIDLNLFFGSTAQTNGTRMINSRVAGQMLRRL
jgi:hypothetical protein